MADWVRYFASEIPPTNLEETRKTIHGFTASHTQNARNVVFITSGGTTVPLESNTVRFIDNFSSGSRGAASAEYFLAQGYAVIFVYRQKSALPFQRYFTGHNPLEFLNVQETTNTNNASAKQIITVDESKCPGLKDILNQYKEVKRNGTLLQIEFTTLSSYLFLLRMSAETLCTFGNRIMFYLAGAVSDFYIPRDSMPTHKIQSSHGPLMLNLQQTPKLLLPLVKEWAPQAFVVSFKLETDVNIISKKARESLQRNFHQVVISNILQTRRKTVVIVTATEENAIWMSDSELEQGKDIEEKIVADLGKKHDEFIRGNSLQGYASSSELSLDKSFPITTTSGQVVYLSEGNTFQLQGKLGDSPTALLLSGCLAQSMSQPMAISQYAIRKADEPVVSRSVSTSSNELSSGLLSPGTSLPKFRFMCDSALSEDMKSFIENFKNKRMTLGYTQEDVGNELSRTNGPTYSQSFISRFESKQLGLKASERMRPILQTWLDAKDIDTTTGVRICKKRRRRTSFTNDALAVLVENFRTNPKPNAAEIALIAEQLKIEPVTVKVWFCNRKQMEKRRSLGKIKIDNTLKSELEARTKVKDQEKSETTVEGEQYAPYSTERLQPLIPEEANQTVANHTVVSTEEHPQTSTSPYSDASVTAMQAEQSSSSDVQYQEAASVTTNQEDANPTTIVSPLNSPDTSFENEC